MGFLIANRMTDINFEAVKSDSKAARTLMLIIIFNDDLCGLTDVTFVYFSLTSTYVSIYGETKSNSPTTDELL